MRNVGKAQKRKLEDDKANKSDEKGRAKKGLNKGNEIIGKADEGERKASKSTDNSDQEGLKNIEKASEGKVDTTKAQESKGNEIIGTVDEEEGKASKSTDNSDQEGLKNIEKASEGKVDTTKAQESKGNEIIGTVDGEEEK